MITNIHQWQVLRQPVAHRLLIQGVRELPHATEESLPLGIKASVNRPQVGRRNSRYTQQMIIHGVVD
jgi:hypothetical protein